MRQDSRLSLLLALLAALVLGPALTGCSAGLNTQLGTQQTPDVAQMTPLAPAVTATPPASATTAPTQEPTVAAPTRAQPSPSLTPTPAQMPEGAQTIRQEIVVRSSSEEGGITSQGTFTMTAEIQVGVVDGIHYTSESVPMPKGAMPYSMARLPAIGEAVQGADGLVVQVTGRRTVDVDAANQFVLVDLVVGNAGKERQLVATNPCMEIVSGDGHWYSAIWYGLYWLGTGGEAYAEAKGKEMHDNLLKKGIKTDFSVALDPGQAARGTAVFPVPKSARQLAFGFQSYLASTYLFFSNEAGPTIFVPLGLGGDFPTVPGNVAALKAGTTYRVGQSFRAPQRGVAFQVQSAWARRESLGNMWTLAPDEQFVVVNVLAPAGAGAKPLDQTRELALVDQSGKAFALQEYASDWLTARLGPFNQRGVLVFKGLRAATGLKLQFAPLDPATMEGSSPKPLAGESVVIDLGQVPVAPAAPMPTPANRPTATRQPTATPAPGAAGHSLGDRVELGSLAIEVRGWSTHSGPEGFEAGEGKVWVLAYVTVENLGGASASVDPESFAFVDRAGAIHNNLLNKPSAWPKISEHVLEYTHLEPGATVVDRIVAVAIEEATTPGLKLRFTALDGRSVMWDLGM